MVKAILVGNPNTGKTTLFNSLTGAHEHVGNWHGVTVEEREKRYNYKGQDISLVDLPGIYSLSPLSYEEKVAVEYLEKSTEKIVINICDASNLQRNLYLTLNLLEMGLSVILAVNQIDKRPLCKIDFAKLEKMLGIKVVYLNASDKKSVLSLNEEILKKYKEKLNGKPRRTASPRGRDLPYISSLGILEYKNKLMSLGGVKDDTLAQFYAVKLFEDDERVKEKFGLKELTFGRCEDVAQARYDYIDQIVLSCCSPKERVYGKSKLDKILLNRFLALPIFLCFIAIAFYLTFFSIGAWLSDGLSFLLERFIQNPVLMLLDKWCGQGGWIYSLFQNAIFGGVGSILSFLPQVGLLFLFLSLLEDSGYLSRVAFVFEDLLGKVGLSGKSVYTLLMGFGCSTTAVLTARNMEDKNSKIKTGLLTPYMSCSAKFPIYSVLGGAFFGARNIFVIMGLYMLGVAVSILISYLLEKTVLKSKQQSFILEFPPYRTMSFKRVIGVLWLNVRQFMTRVGSLIIAMNVIVWGLSNFTITLKYVGTDGVSMLETFGKILSPIFKPLGFSNWGLVSSLIAGLVAKEVIVSSIAMFGGIACFTGSASVLSYMVFCLLYFPCFATMAVLSKEIGKKWTAIGLLIEFIVAYIVSCFIYSFVRAGEVFGVEKVLLFIISIFVIVLSVVYIYKKFKAKKFCPHGKNCDKKCRYKK